MNLTYIYAKCKWCYHTYEEVYCSESESCFYPLSNKKIFEWNQRFVNYFFMLLTSCHANTIVELYYNLLQNKIPDFRYELIVHHRKSDKKAHKFFDCWLKANCGCVLCTADQWNFVALNLSAFLRTFQWVK